MSTVEIVLLILAGIAAIAALIEPVRLVIAFGLTLLGG